MATVGQMKKNQRGNDRLMHEQSNPPREEDATGAFGRRVYLESPSLGNKEEEDMYRYVPSRLSENPASVLGHVPPMTTAPTSAALMDSLDLELDLLGTNNARSRIPPYSTLTQPIASRPPPISDPRQDPLLGPLLAELDAMSSTQPTLNSTVYPRTTVPSYDSNLLRTNALSQPNLTTTADRTINDALLDSELYGPLSTNPQQRAPPRLPFNSSNYSQLPPPVPAPAPPAPPVRSTNMNTNDAYMPSSYPYEPTSFLTQYGPEDQLFQRPSLNNLGQNYLSNPARQQDPSMYTPPNYHHQQQPPPPPQHQQPSYQPPSPRQRYASDNQEIFFTDHPEHTSQPPVPQMHGQDEDSRRQAVWNDLQRTNQQKRDSAQPMRSNASWHAPNSQPSSIPSKSSSQHQYRPSVGTRVNHIDENVDMIRNKENSYHRSPSKKYENSYARRKEQESYEHESQPPPSTDQGQTNSPGRAVAIPLNSQVNRVGDKISLNIDLQLVDPQNSKEPSSNPGQWSGVDPLDRHIRKLERNLDQSLPHTNPPTRNPTVPNTGAHGSPSNRMGKSNRGGYNPPMYGNEKPQEDDSYLAKLNYARKNPSFKPYTGRDYEEFKKNYGFGTGNLGFSFDHTTYKEKVEKLTKTREYAQQVEARNKKKLSNANRTWSDTRISGKPSMHGQRPLDDADLPLNHSQHPARYSGTSTHSLPTAVRERDDEIPRRRPTEVFTLPKQLPTVQTRRVHQLPPLPANQSKRRGMPFHPSDPIRE